MKPRVQLMITPTIRESKRQAFGWGSTEKRIKTRLNSCQFAGKHTSKRVQLCERCWRMNEEIEHDPNASQSRDAFECVWKRWLGCVWMRSRKNICARIRNLQTRSSRIVGRCVCRPIHDSFLSERVRTLTFATKTHLCASKLRFVFTWEGYDTRLDSLKTEPYWEQRDAFKAYALKCQRTPIRSTAVRASISHVYWTSFRTTLVAPFDLPDKYSLASTYSKRGYRGWLTFNRASCSSSFSK